MWPKEIFAITLFVEDVEVATAFYRETFDLPVVYADEVSAVFGFGPALINLLQRGEAHDLIAPALVGAAGSGARMQLTINVADIDAVCAELAGRGVAFLNGPQDRPWGIRTACFSDPDGHIWEIAAPLDEESHDDGN